jgi:hypothetical protein
MASTAKRSDPDLWETVKRSITSSDKGGRKGQWSARKAQLAVQEYKRRGGGYVGAKRDDNSLRQWTKEEWGTKSGRRSRDSGERYLPKKAQESLSPEEYRRTSEKKRQDTKAGHQFSAQPKAIADKAARHRHTGKEPTKAALMQEARHRGIPGRSRMDKLALRHALGR